VLVQGRKTLGDLTTALTALRPTLREIPPAAGPLNDFLSLVTPTVRRATPVIAQLRAQVPNLKRALAGFPVLKPLAVRGLGATQAALSVSAPILRGFRLYGADFILGIFNGLLGIISGNYDKAGHYGHIEYTQSPVLLPGGTLGATLPNLSGLSALSPALFALRTHQVSRCPGGANPAAPDGSNPWVVDQSLCNQSQNLPSSVNHP
jgi:hypothetical protein